MAASNLDCRVIATPTWRANEETVVVADTPSPGSLDNGILTDGARNKSHLDRSVRAWIEADGAITRKPSLILPLTKLVGAT